MLADINESFLWVHGLLAMFGPIVSFERDSAPKLTQPAPLPDDRMSCQSPCKWVKLPYSP